MCVCSLRFSVNIDVYVCLLPKVLSKHAVDVYVCLLPKVLSKHIDVYVCLLPKVLSKHALMCMCVCSLRFSVNMH